MNQIHYLFRHASVSSTYPGQSVRNLSVICDTFRFPFCHRRDDIVVADMEVHMAADNEVDKMANMAADKKNG